MRTESRTFIRRSVSLAMSFAAFIPAGAASAAGDAFETAPALSPKPAPIAGAAPGAAVGTPAGAAPAPGPASSPPTGAVPPSKPAHAANAPLDGSQYAALRDHVSRGNTLMAHRQYAPAIDEYEKSLAIDPNNQIAKSNLALAHNNWGIAYFAQKKYDEAAAEWEMSLKIQPNQVSAKRNMQILQATLDRLGLQLGYDEPPAKETAPAAPAAESQGETAEGEADAAKKPGTKAAGKPTFINGGVNGGASPGSDEAESAPGVDTFKMSAYGQGAPGKTDNQGTMSPAKRAASPAAAAKAAEQAAQTKPNPSPAPHAASGDAFDAAPTTQVMSYPSSMTNPAATAAAPAEAAAGNAPGVMGAAPDPSLRQGFYAEPGATPTQAGADAQPEAAQVAPATQVYENKEAGTSITIISKPQAPVQMAPPPPPVVQTPDVYAPAQPSAPVVFSDSGASPQNNSGTIDDNLVALEMKVFGKKQKNMPIMKRLEKLEIGTSGSAGQGTVQERVDSLRRAYGL